MAAGQRYGRLIAIEHADGSAELSRWRFRCDCGSETVAYATNVRAGRTKGCGCGYRAHGLSRTPEYLSWAAMRQRCNDPKNKSFSHYGGRGIRVCEAWDESFTAFLADVGPRPSLDHSLDRWPDVNGNYEPDNVRWATRSEQQRNKRNSRG